MLIQLLSTIYIPLFKIFEKPHKTELSAISNQLSGVILNEVKNLNALKKRRLFALLRVTNSLNSHVTYKVSNKRNFIFKSAAHPV